MTTERAGFKRATSTDVAAHAGVSRSTVSQILNGDDRFPEATRARVAAAAAALDYRPSRAGRALVTGLSDIVVVVVPNATFGPHLQDSVDRITSASAGAGLSVVVRFGGIEDASTLESVLDLRPAAVVDFGVFTDAQRERLHATGTRIVPRRPPIRTDADGDPFDIHIGRLQVGELSRTGDRRLIYAALADTRLDPFGPPRLEGIEREARERRLAPPTTVRVPLDAVGARSALRDALDDAPNSPVGVCCYNDDVAIAVLAVARELGLRVPEDVAVVGVDNTAIGQLVSPRLTTIAVDQRALMDSLVHELAALRDRDEPRTRTTVDPAEVIALVPGETT